MRYKVSLSEGFAHQDTAPTGWVVKRLGDCAELVREHFDPTNGETRPYIGLEHIQPGTLRLCGVGKSSEVTSGKFAFRAGDILFGKLRPYFRKVVRPSFDGVCSTDIFVIRAKPGTDQRFLFYWLAMPETIEIATQTSEGTRMPRAVWDVLAKIERPVPPLPEQQRIAEILGAFDDKIELNHRMNRTLEAIARAIFKSWFVDFEPFRDGEFVDSELGPIPKSWEVKPITELANFIDGRAFKQHEWAKRGLPIVRIAELNNGITDSTNFFSGDIEDKHRTKNGEILFSWSASIGIYIWTGGDAVINQHIFRVVSKYVSPWFIYYRLQIELPRFQAIAQDKVTTMGHIQRCHLEETLVAIPPQGILHLIEPLMDRIFRLMVANLIESKLLAEIRDHLLPKLLSGEIRVKNGPIGSAEEYL